MKIVTLSKCICLFVCCMNLVHFVSCPELRGSMVTKALNWIFDERVLIMEYTQIDSSD